MWFSTILRAGRPRTEVRVWQLSLAGLTLLLLSGCGGGSSVTNSSTSVFNGYRIVPAGGIVQPLNGTSTLVLTAPAGAVDQGVQVSADAETEEAQLPAAKPIGTTFITAYQLSFSPAAPTFHLPITLKILFTPRDPQPSGQQYAIYTYTGGEWVLLPGTVIARIDSTQTTIASYINGTGLVPGTSMPFVPALTTVAASQVYAVLRIDGPGLPTL